MLQKIIKNTYKKDDVISKNDFENNNSWNFGLDTFFTESKQNNSYIDTIVNENDDNNKSHNLIIDDEKIKSYRDKKLITTCNPTSFTTTSPSLRLEIFGQINKIHHSFVIDTGATVSIINVKKLPTLVKLKQINFVNLITANGSNLELLGTVDVTLNFNNVDFPIKYMVVENLVGPSLLGTDFLNKYQANIDFVNKQIILLGNERSVTLRFGHEVENLNKSQKLIKINHSGNVLDLEKTDLSINEKIRLIAESSYKLNEVPSDGFCGINALSAMLNHEGIYVTTEKIAELLNIKLNNQPIWLEGEDISAVANYYDFNLLIICPNVENSNTTAGIAFYKSNRRFLIVFFENNHWTPGGHGNNKYPKLSVERITFVSDFRSINTSREILGKRAKLNIERPYSQQIEQMYLNNQNHNNSDKYLRPNTSFNRIINHLPDDNILNNKLKFDINPDLSTENKNKLLSLLYKYEIVFSKSKWDLGESQTDPVDIKLTNSIPINLPNFKLSKFERDEIEEQTQEMLRAGIIEPSHSPYSFPVFLVAKGLPQGTKKDKTNTQYRMVLDYRKLNSITVKEAFPLPVIQSIYDCLAGNKFFSCLDAMSGFHQLKLNDKAKELTAFCTLTGKYQFKRLPMGICNGPSKYQEAMNKIMTNLNYRINVNYIDDCTCFGKTFDEHLNSLELTLERFKQFNLKLKVSKCKFGYTELKILGNIISREGIRPTDEGLVAVKQFPSPTNINQLRSFLGLANYFRRYIPNFSKITFPLTELTKGDFKTKKDKIKWENKHENAFNELKSKLTTPPVLMHFNENLDTILVTDASQLGLGIILQQRDEYGNIHPVSFASKKLLPAQKNYSALELEASALYFACTYYRQYIFGKEFTVWTDHKNLEGLQKLKSDSYVLNRIRTKLIGYEFNIIYKQGIFNKAADFLSRHPIGFDEAAQINYESDSNLNIYNINSEKLNNIISYDNFKNKTKDGVTFKFHINQVNEDLFSSYFDETFSLVHCVSKDFVMSEGIAIQFKNIYGKVDELMAQNKLVGELAFLKFNGQYIIYLITKLKYNIRPTYESLFNTLKYLKKFCCSHNIKKLAMPKIACGLDQLDWNIVFNMLKYVYDDTTIDITVSTFTPSKQIISLVEPINIHLLQTRDDYLQKIISTIQNPKSAKINWIRKSKSYIINSEDNLLYYRDIYNGTPKLVIALPNELKKQVIEHFHDEKMSGAHLGLHKVFNKIRSRYHWPSMRKDIKNYVVSCQSCQQRKPDKRPAVGMLQPNTIINGIPFQDICIDYVGPMIMSRGFKYILVATCRATKFCYAKPFKNADAKSTTRFLLELILTYGPPRIVRSDNGTHFTAKVIKQLLLALGIEKTEGITYRPTSQGQVERQNQVITDMISPYVANGEKWTDVLPIVLHAYNTAIHCSTGFTPFYLVHGYEPQSLFDIAVIPSNLDHSVIDEIKKLNSIRQKLPEILKKAFDKQKFYADKGKNNIEFYVGEKVLIKTNVKKDKFSDRYEGPYTITKKINPVTYLVEIIKNRKKYIEKKHIHQIKQYRDRSEIMNVFYYS